MARRRRPASPPKPADLSRVKTTPIRRRRSKVSEDLLAKVSQPRRSLASFLDSLPDILKARDLREQLPLLGLEVSLQGPPGIFEIALRLQEIGFESSNNLVSRDSALRVELLCEIVDSTLYLFDFIAFSICPRIEDFQLPLALLNRLDGAFRVQETDVPRLRRNCDHNHNKSENPMNTVFHRHLPARPWTEPRSADGFESTADCSMGLGGNPLHLHPDNACSEVGILRAC